MLHDRDAPAQLLCDPGTTRARVALRIAQPKADLLGLDALRATAEPPVLPVVLRIPADLYDALQRTVERK